MLMMMTLTDVHEYSNRNNVARSIIGFSYLQSISNIQYPSFHWAIYIQGVPQLSIHFVLVVFSASSARTDVYFTIFQQPRR